MRECYMASKYPQSVLDSLKEYSEMYKLNTQEYKNLMSRIEKIPSSVMEKLEILNKGKTNLDKGSVVVVRLPTAKGKVTHAYIALTGTPRIQGDKGEIPILDLHALNVVEENPMDSIRKIPTSDKRSENETNTQGMFVISEEMLKPKKEEPEEIEILDTPKRVVKKKAPKKEEIVEKKPTAKKKETKKVKSEEIIEIPDPEEMKKSHQKILETAKKIKEDKEKEKEREEERKLEEAYNKMRFACVSKIHGMGYSKKEAESLCDDFDDILHEHASSAVIKKTPTAVEEYVRLLTDKVIPARVSKPKKTRPFEPIKHITPEETLPTVPYANPEGLLEMACLWLMGRYNQPMDRGYTLCEERRADIRRLARAMSEGKMSLITATRELENLIVEKSSLTTVISGYQEKREEDQIKLAEEKRRKVSAKTKEEAVLGAFSDKLFGKASTKAGYAARSELQKRASEKLERMIGTSTREISVQLKGKAAIILEFQCYKSTGLDKTECFREYISGMKDHYGFALTEIPNGWAAHFQANVLPGGDIVMIHNGKEYRNFLKMVDEIKDEYEKPQHVLVWVNSFVDKSEYSRIL